MGSIFLLAGQIDALPLFPELHCLRSPLFTRKTRYLNLAECGFLFQQLAAKKFRNALCILAVELKVTVLLVADQSIRVTLFQRVILVGGIQRQRLQRLLRRLFICKKRIFLGFLNRCDG